MLVLKNEVNSFWGNFCPGETITTHFSFISDFVGNRRKVSKLGTNVRCSCFKPAENSTKMSLENCCLTSVIVKKSYWLFFKKRRASVVNKVHVTSKFLRYSEVVFSVTVGTRENHGKWTLCVSTYQYFKRRFS